MSLFLLQNVLGTELTERGGLVQAAGTGSQGIIERPRKAGMGMISVCKEIEGHQVTHE